MSDVLQRKAKLSRFLTENMTDQRLATAVCEFMTKRVPGEFWTIAASSTGKYHPEYSLGDGGLFRHTMAALMIAKDLLVISKLKTPREFDIVYAALAMHDSCKRGWPEYKAHTEWTHPLLAAKAWDEYAEDEDLDEEVSDLISSCIASHMGQWNTNKYSKIELPLPESKLQKLVHICDYLASRKSLTVDTDSI